MTVLELGALQPYQLNSVLVWLSATYAVQANLSGDGHFQSLSRNLIQAEQDALIAQVAVIKASADPAVVRTTADSTIRGAWDQALGTMTTTQVLAILVQANRELFVQIYSADVSQLANYIAAINATLSILSGLPPRFVTEFTNERTALGLGTNATGATLATCRTWHQFLRGWMAGVALWAQAAKQSGVSD